MGMYDSVIAECPNCGNEIEFQSKAGECGLLEYGITSVPTVIAGDINGNSKYCVECGVSLEILIPTMQGRVCMSIFEN